MQTFWIGGPGGSEVYCVSGTALLEDLGNLVEYFEIEWVLSVALRRSILDELRFPYCISRGC